MPSAAVAAPSAAEVQKAAQTHGKSEAEIRAILADKTAKVDKTGRIYYVDSKPETAPSGPAAEKGPYPYTDTFLLHSKPGSNRTIYLDFDGHTIQNTAWNGTFGSPVGPFFAEEFSLDASAAFSDAEQDIVQSVWQRVAEDYAPFDVDVTTQDPGLAALDRTDAADQTYGSRALITDAPEIGSTCGCGGIAYVGVFNLVAPQHEQYQPAFTFAENLGSDAKNIAEATSHEVGHNLNLNHDGTSAVGYYTGHGAWAPIMGVGYYEPVVQFSKGEYSDANNTQDDIAVMGAIGLPVRADDVGDTTGTALDKGTGPAMSHSGIVSTDADVDVFKITAGSGASTFTVNPAPNSPNLDARLQLLNGAGTVIATNDPPATQSSTDVATGLSATIAMNLPSAGTYYVAVDGVGYLSPLNTGYSGYGSLGAYSLSGTFTPSGGVNNNNFGGAALITGSNGTVNGSNIGANMQVGEPNHAGVVGGKSIWYKWQAPAGGTVTFSTSGSAIDTLLAVYTGTAVNALTHKASNDDDGAATTSKVSLAVTKNTVYRIAVDGKAGAAGAVVLNWSTPPLNDALTAAKLVTGAAGTTSGSNVGATKETGEPNHAGFVGGKSVWFKWQAPAGGTVTIDTFGSSFDTLLGVYTGTAVNALTLKASNDDTGGLQSSVTFAATSGTVYRIAVDGFAAASGNITLNWVQRPPNDAFASARLITGLSGTSNATTVNASRETDEPVHGTGNARSIWFKWQAPKNGTLTIDTFGSAYDTLLGMYTGLAVNALTTIQTNDDVGGLQSQIVQAVTAGTTYRFAVDGYNGANGAVTLHWSLP